jgi:hypothetical protein
VCPVNGIWQIPSEKQEKEIPGEFSPSALLLEGFRVHNRVEDKPYIFAATRGGGHFSGWSMTKRVLD